MPRFVRGQPEGEAVDHGLPFRDGHERLVHLVNVYSPPLEPDPESLLSVRDQHLTGICRPRQVRDVTWQFGPPAR